MPRSFNPLGGGAGSGPKLDYISVRVVMKKSFNPLGSGAGSGPRDRCNDWPDMSLGSGFPYPPENGTKLGSLSLAPASPGKRKRREENRLGQVVTGARNRVDQGYEICQSKKRRARPPRSGTGTRQGDRRKPETRRGPVHSPRNGARQAVSASLDDEHDLVAGTDLELGQAQEDCLLLAGRADRVDDHPILGRLNQGGQNRNQIVKEPMVQDHLKNTILHPAAVVIQALRHLRPARGVGDVVTDQVSQGLAIGSHGSVSIEQLGTRNSQLTPEPDRRAGLGDVQRWHGICSLRGLLPITSAPAATRSAPP